DMAAPPRHRRHLLPGIATGVAVPLIYEDQVYGVLDVQQNEDKSLNQTDIALLKSISRQVSAAIAQLRELQELRNTLEAQETTLKQQNMKLLRHEQNTLRATLDSWSSYLQQRGIDYMGFDFQDAQLSPDLRMELPESLREALTAGEITVSVDQNEQRRVNIPILLSGHMMGAMSFRLPPGASELSTHQRELVDGVVQRLALALENKRLLEQTRAQVERESLANAIGGVLLSAPDVQQILLLASEQFMDAVGAVQTRINIRPEPSETVEELS
ncbi:MAG: GAF domain-containing protein, partial [Anaerolineae bacterium]|nr:GAF domain-containing protein [Anaerolineae bacterium]